MATDTRSTLHRLIDQLAEADLDAARAFLEFLRTRHTVSGDIVLLEESIPMAERLPRVVPGDDTAGDPVLRALIDAPEDDEPLTPEDIAAIAEAREAAGRGEIESWDTVRAELLGKG